VHSELHLVHQLSTQFQPRVASRPNNSNKDSREKAQLNSLKTGELLRAKECKGNSGWVQRLERSGKINQNGSGIFTQKVLCKLDVGDNSVKDTRSTAPR
jgi:hypothetical protein